MQKLLTALLCACALGAGARATSAQVLRVSVGGDGFRAELGLGRGYAPAVRPRYAPVVAPAGSWQEVRRQVWVPAARQRVWQEPCYAERRDACGRLVRVLVRAGGWCWVETPGHLEWRTERVWVPGPVCGPRTY